MRALVAEFLGTFALVFAGTGEVVLAFLLALVVLVVSSGSKERGVLAGVSIGAVVGLAALFAGPISGASMNPARSLGPALVSGELADVWIYLLAPAVGALLAVPACRFTQPTSCCLGSVCP